MMYGTQHDYILDDRDVDAYNMNRKFEQFAHLRQEVQKLIVYSTVETILFLDRVNLWSDQGLRRVARAISESYGGIKRAGANLPAPYTGSRSQMAGISDNGQEPFQFGGVCAHNHRLSLYQETV